MRPVPYDVNADRLTLWVDYATGAGITSRGVAVQAKARARRRPALVDLLDLARAEGAARVVLTGKVPDPTPGRPHWLLADTPGWVGVGHWIGQGPPTGRFRLDAEREDRPTIEVATAAQWFGSTEGLDPRRALAGHQLTAAAIAGAVPGGRLFTTPTGTAGDLWARLLPRGYDPELLPEDVSEVLHHTSGQHRMEHLVVGGACGCGHCRPTFAARSGTLSPFVYIDGRFMYASLCRELGIGLARRLTRAQAAELLDTDEYARAWLHVRATVPATWDHVGILPTKLAGTRDWHWPNAPGAVLDVWADAAEVHVAMRAGWGIDPIEGFEWNRAPYIDVTPKGDHKTRHRKPLDAWSTTLTKARTAVEEQGHPDPVVTAAATAALRNVLIHGIGAFASRSRDVTRTSTSARDVPAGVAPQRYGSLYVWREAGGKRHAGQAQPYYRPELAVQVWGRGRARVLSGPSGLGASTAGALATDPAHLMGINGDAIYTDTVPAWSLPTSHGGGDDGRAGRLRLKGALPRVRVPADKGARDRLRARAEAAGPASALPAQQDAS